MSLYAQQLVRYPELGISLDFSKLPLDDAFLSSMQGRIDRAFADMKALESGAIANPDEKRMVGHYWLRNSALAPTPELKAAIDGPLADVKAFGQDVLDGKITPPRAEQYSAALVIGIGGSALGPELVADAIPAAGLDMFFLDNTDPDGMYRVLESLPLEETLVVVISKSGGTPETRNGMLVAQDFFRKNGLEFAPQAVAVTGVGSKLDKTAEAEGWLKRFPMEDWVGGRTSVMSVVGLVPAVLQGVDVDELLEGARLMDEKTRQDCVKCNAAMKLALAWYKATNGKGEKDMVVLPYKDALVLFSKYLQQLIMESLGKRLDLDGNEVCQGISVYGNKGSTDQHAYVQQLRDGVNNFFATFIDVRECSAVVNAKTLGMLVALFERAVSFYASLVNINAYHQPGVEAGKKAAGTFLALLGKVRAALGSTPETAAQVAARLDADQEAVYHCLVHIASSDSSVKWVQAACADEDTFCKA